jgi:CpXC protein
MLPEETVLQIEEWRVVGKRKAPATREASTPKAPRKSTKQQQAAAVASDTATATEVAANAPEMPERGLSDVDEMLLSMGAQPVTADEEQATEAPVDLDALIAKFDPLATFWTELDLRCRDCAIIHYVNFCTLLNAEESPHLVERARLNQFNYKRCPVCHKIEYVEHPWTFFDPQRKLVVQIRPEWEWHAGGGEEWYAVRLEDLFDKWAEHDVQIDVTFGPEQFIERYLQDESGSRVVGQSGSEETPSDETSGE